MRRLFEDPEQPQALRDELLRSRDAGRNYPTEHKLAQLQAALADSSRQPDVHTEAGPGLAARVLHPAWKLALVAAVGGGIVAWLAWPAAPVRRSSELRVFVPAQAKVEPAPPPPPPPPTEPSPIPPPAAAEPAPAPAVSTPAAAARAEPASELPAPDAAAKSSRREIAQLIRIRSLLARDPAAALRLAERSEREFPLGLLSEERRALAIVALAKTGARESAAAKAREYFARYPQSTMRGLIEAALDREAR